MLEFLRRVISKMHRSTSRALWSTPTAQIEWFQVTYDSETIRMAADPPGDSGWVQEFRWNEIERICFKAENMLVSDGIYVFTSKRRESYVIPTEARGGCEFWEEILRRGLFDPGLAIKAALSNGGLFCWPPIDRREFDG